MTENKVTIDLTAIEMCDACKENLPIIAAECPSDILPLVLMESVSGHCMQALLQAVFPPNYDA
jgi:hypothetical protein